MPCMPRVDSLRDELSKVKEGRNGENGAAELQIGSGIWKWHAACPIHARDPPPLTTSKATRTIESMGSSGSACAWPGLRSG